ncbi:MAG TPA: BBP7 family outer membrane beta-barrel protein, partial [Gemmataceae bacterium]|nr:BBP7 family outer membrane beta-barrel protein [Gemmataceae bacterium]
MNRRYLAALLVVLAAAGSAVAGEEPDGSMRTWLDADYLLWWLQPAPGGPALLTTGNLTNPTSLGSGILGNSGTQILAGNNNLNTGPYSGFRISGGWINCANSFGVDGSFFYLGQQGIHQTFSSDGSGNPLLARPIVDARTGAETVLFVSAPNAFNGTFHVDSTTGFYGFDANMLLPWYRCFACDDSELGYYLTPIGGFRYLNLRDDLTLSQSSNVLPTGVAFFDGQPLSFGSNVSVVDDFRTLNQFYGGQIGLKAGLTWWRFTLNGTAKVALGTMREEANIAGSTTANNPLFGTTLTVPGGLYAVASNSGAFTRNVISVVPEGNLNFAVEITPQIKLMVGYTIIYLSDVARAGNLIDRSVNRTEVPSSQSFNLAVPGPQQPGF